MDYQEHTPGNKQEEIDYPHRKEDSCTEETPSSNRREAVDNPSDRLRKWKSLNDYDEESEKEQQQLSNIISVTPQSAASSSSPDLLVWSFPPTKKSINH